MIIQKTERAEVRLQVEFLNNTERAAGEVLVIQENNNNDSGLSYYY